MDQMRALFLVSPVEIPHNTNHELIPDVLRRHGWAVETAPHESLVSDNGRLCCEHHLLAEFDLIWPVGFGPAGSYLDRTQLLSSDPSLPMITPPESVTRLHSKIAWLEFAPASCVARNAHMLRSWGEANPGPWMLKPNAGSHGTNVTYIEDLNHLDQLIDAKTSAYWILQRFIPAIAEGELRVIVVGGEVIGAYLRQPSPGSHLANLARGGQARPAQLNEAQAGLLKPVIRRLIGERVGYAAIDLCGEWVMEVNVANPGGLATLENLYGDAPLQRFVTGLQTWLKDKRNNSN